MSNGLTGKWKSGELEGGHYYLLMNDGSIRIANTIYVVGEKKFYFENSSIDFVQEVLAPVPSYEEYKRLQEQLDELQNENNNLCNDIVDLNLTIENREKQLNEANEVLKDTAHWATDEVENQKKAQIYCYKWGVK